MPNFSFPHAHERQRAAEEASSFTGRTKAEGEDFSGKGEGGEADKVWREKSSFCFFSLRAKFLSLSVGGVGWGGGKELSGFLQFFFWGGGGEGAEFSSCAQVSKARTNSGAFSKTGAEKLNVDLQKRGGGGPPKPGRCHFRQRRRWRGPSPLIRWGEAVEMGEEGATATIPHPPPLLCFDPKKKLGFLGPSTFACVSPGRV